MITRKDLEMQFCKATGTVAKHYRQEFIEWVEQSYIELLNKVEEDQTRINALFTDKDGE
jgi:hypothetical protein